MPIYEVMEKTTIAIDVETADRLHALKKRGMSYDEVVRELLNNYEEQSDSE